MFSKNIPLIDFIRILFNKSIVRYFFIGGINTMLSFLSFSVLYYVGFHYILAAFLNLVIGVSISYYNHRRFTFKKNFDYLEKFVPICLVYFFLNSILLKISDDAGFNIYLAYLLILLPTSIINYFVLKLFVFKD